MKRPEDRIWRLVLKKDESHHPGDFSKAKNSPLSEEFLGGGEPSRELRFSCLKEVSHLMGLRS